MHRILLLINPIFESLRRRHLPSILRVFEQAAIEVEVLEATPDRNPDSLIQRAVHSNVDAVIIAGGDGTVFDALQGLAGSQVPLGILPFGTGNILAQNLKIPRHPVEAAQWLLQAKPRPIPLGKITCPVSGGTQSWFFAMAAGMGGHAAMMSAAERYGKHRTGRLAYFAAGFETLLSYSVQPFEVEITTLDDRVLTRSVSEMILVRVAELNLWRPGGGFELPFLRLASVEGASRLRLARASVEALLLGAGQRDRPARPGAAGLYEDIKRVHARPLPGIRYKQPIPIEADGEILATSSATFEMAGVSIHLLANA